MCCLISMSATIFFYRAVKKGHLNYFLCAACSFSSRLSQPSSFLLQFTFNMKIWTGSVFFSRCLAHSCSVQTGLENRDTSVLCVFMDDFQFMLLTVHNPFWFWIVYIGSIIINQTSQLKWVNRLELLQSYFIKPFCSLFRNTRFGVLPISQIITASGFVPWEWGLFHVHKYWWHCLWQQK